MNQQLETKKDDRGELTEIFKVPGFGQVYYVIVKPNATRGNHYHSRKKEKFCVIQGQAKITLKDRATKEIKEVVVSEEKLEIINIPENWSHNIKNIGEKNIKLLAWTSETYDPKDPDTYPEKLN
jgi:UDP-2-acetamido-2,6-beta-L-arabino-hexul-4-ose reductase